MKSTFTAKHRETLQKFVGLNWYEDLTEAINAALAEIDRCPSFDDAANRAYEELPPGYRIEAWIGDKAGGISLEYPDGHAEDLYIEGEHGFVRGFLDCIEIAKEQASDSIVESLEALREASGNAWDRGEDFGEYLGRKSGDVVT